MATTNNLKILFASPHKAASFVAPPEINGKKEGGRMGAFK